jgi:hypothetical protein
MYRSSSIYRDDKLIESDRVDVDRSRVVGEVRLRVEELEKPDGRIEVEATPVLLKSYDEACRMLGIGLTLCKELCVEGVLHRVKMGRRVGITTESIYRAAEVDWAESKKA